MAKAPQFSKKPDRPKRIADGQQSLAPSRLHDQIRFLGLFAATLFGGYFGLVLLIHLSLPAQKAMMQFLYQRIETSQGTRDDLSRQDAAVPIEVQVDRKCVPNYRQRLVNQASISSDRLTISRGGMMEPGPDLYWTTNGYGPGAIVKPHEVTAYFRCIMTEQVERFCQPAQRKHLANQLVSLLEFRTRVLTLVSVPAIPKGTAMGLSSYEYAQILRRIRNEVDSWLNSIGPQVRYLSQAGYFSARDFGFMTRVPELLQPFVVEKLQHRCQ